MAEEVRSEQLNQKVTPSTRKRLDDILKKMGHSSDPEGHVKWDQEKLLEILGIVESTLVLDEHEKYADVVAAINQYTSLINAKLISIISDLDTTEARIRSEYEKKLSSKDMTIRELQEQRSAQESEKKSALEDAEKSKDAKTIAEKNLLDVEDRLKSAEDTIRDKESIIQMLTGKLKESEEKLAGYDGIKSSEATLRDQVTVLLHKTELVESELKHETNIRTSAQEEITQLKNQIESLRESAEQQKEQLQNELQMQIESGKTESDQLKAEIVLLKRDLEEEKRSAEQELKLAVERAVSNTKDEMRDQIDQIRNEKTRLEVQLELLQK